MRTASSSERPPTASSDSDAALARAVVWRFLALGFSRPGPALRADLGEAQRRQALAAALDDLGLSLRPGPDGTDLDQRYSVLFGHTVRAAICPYETEYGGGQVFQQAQELADLRGWYAAFGLEHRPDVAERPDHLAVECEFAGFLCLKEAYTLERGERDQAQASRQAYRGFLRDHLARFGRAVTVRLEALDGDGFHGRVAALARSFLDTECRRLEVQAGPRALPLRSDEDDVPAACGAGDCDPACGDEGLSPFGRSMPGGLLTIGAACGKEGPPD